MVLPVSMLTSLKGWHQEFIFVRGGDLEFMPLYKLEIKTDRFPVQRLGQAALVMVYAFCGALGTQWTRDTFNSNESMHAAGCIPKLIPYPPNMSAQLKDLSAKLRRIGGMTSLDSGKKKVSEGEDAARKAAPSRPGRTTIVINEPQAEDVQQGDATRVPAPRKRKSAPAGSGEKGGEGSEGHVAKKAAVELAPDTPETLKALLASFTPETRRREHFENYASTAERKKYRNEPLDDFLAGLQEDITAVHRRLYLIRGHVSPGVGGSPRVLIGSFLDDYSLVSWLEILRWSMGYGGPFIQIFHISIPRLGWRWKERSRNGRFALSCSHGHLDAWDASEYYRIRTVGTFWIQDTWTVVVLPRVLGHSRNRNTSTGYLPRTRRGQVKAQIFESLAASFLSFLPNGGGAGGGRNGGAGGSDVGWDRAPTAAAA
ncbi:hypothetical protein AgCh_022230 [Apium graveolens]